MPIIKGIMVSGPNTHHKLPYANPETKLETVFFAMPPNNTPKLPPMLALIRIGIIGA